MTLDTTEIVAVTLETQAAKHEELQRTAEQASASHQGARDMIGVLERNLKAVTPAAEAEIMADEDLDGEAQVKALKHVARAMMRVAQSLTSSRQNQANLVYLKQGEATTHKATAESLRQQARVRRDAEQGKAESIARGEAHKAEAAAKAKAKPKRKRATKPKNGATAKPKAKPKAKAKEAPPN
jgi:hypothetical protein